MSANVWPDLESVATAVLADPAPIVLADTCALLDVLRAPLRTNAQASAIRGAQRLLTRATQTPSAVWLIAADLVKSEYARHASDTTAELAREMKQATSRVVAARASADLALPGAVVPLVDLYALGLHTALQQLASRLLGEMHVFGADDLACHARAARRVAKSEAPSSPGKSELADCAIIEHYIALGSALLAGGFSHPIVFVSSNTSDYGAPKHIRAPLDRQFVQSGISFVTDLGWAESLL